MIVNFEICLALKIKVNNFKVLIIIYVKTLCHIYYIIVLRIARVNHNSMKLLYTFYKEPNDSVYFLYIKFIFM